jgi:hypothetical protein
MKKRETWCSGTADPEHVSFYKARFRTYRKAPGSWAFLISYVTNPLPVGLFGGGGNNRTF